MWLLPLLLLLLPLLCHARKDNLHHSLGAPIVVLPSALYWESSNSLVVTPLHKNSSVLLPSSLDISLNGTTLVSGSHQWKAGASNQVSFTLPTLDAYVPSTSLRVEVKVEGHSAFIAHLNALPHLTSIHVFTNKAHFKGGEIVDVRALPLTRDGRLYKNYIELTVINPKNFELMRRMVKVTEERFIRTIFNLPQFLHFGEWRVEARAFGSPTPLGTAPFTVHDYELPPFEVTLAPSSSNFPYEAVPLTVTARYPHGLSVNGHVSIHCSNGTKHSLLTAELSSGEWKGRVNARPCALKNGVKLLAEVHDAGTGVRVHSSLFVDPLAPQFDIVPLRPALSPSSTQLLLTTVPSHPYEDSSIHVDIECMSARMNDRHIGDKRVKGGDTLQVEIGEAASKCAVILVKAWRELENGRSRELFLYIPVLNTSHLNMAWIRPENIATLQKGKTFDVSIDREAAKDEKANYIVYCNDKEVTDTGLIPKSGKLSLWLREEHVGECVMVVYTADVTVHFDILLFFVSRNCQYSVKPSKSHGRPGDKIEMRLNAQGNGTALISAIDNRLNWITLMTDGLSTSNWMRWNVISSDHTVNSPSLLSTKLVNLFNMTELKEKLERSCEAAGVAHRHEWNNTCPEKTFTSSGISLQCVHVMRRKCMESSNTNGMGAVCDPRHPCFKTASVFRTSTVQNLEERESFDDVPLLEREEFNARIRRKLPQVWIFDDVYIPQSGSVNRSWDLPDSIGSWSVSSWLWSNGQRDLCTAEKTSVAVTKSFFLQVEMPSDVYLNETVAVKVVASSDNVEEETLLTLCGVSDRSVCMDEGNDGVYGSDTRITLTPSTPVVTKSFTLAFFHLGTHNVTFVLRKKARHPHYNQCDIGEIYDRVQATVTVNNRAELEEHYRGVILSAQKPVLDLPFLTANTPARNDFIQIREYRSDGATLTEIVPDVKDEEQITAFTIEIAEFLPTRLDLVEPYTEPTTARRQKRNSVDSFDFFLSDVIQKLSSLLSKQRIMMNSQGGQLKDISSLDSAISNAVSDLLRFSNCEEQSRSCGFYQIAGEEKRQSPLLSTLATSLLCSASADQKLVCGALNYTWQLANQAKKVEDELLKEYLHGTSDTDRLWFMRSLLMQTFRDCETYQSCKGVESQSLVRFVSSFHSLDYSAAFDARVIAALSAMATPLTKDSMRRERLATSFKSGDIPPFWRVADDSQGDTIRMRSMDHFFSSEMGKSGDILVNSLALMAFIGKEREVPLQFDNLADWLDEQRSVEDAFGNALDTFFATRALAAYSTSKNVPALQSNMQVEITCDQCVSMKVNVTESSPIFYIPTKVRNVTIVTRGEGKARAGIRIVSAKRQRSRRGNTNKITSPVEFDVTQSTKPSTVIQEVCLRMNSKLVRTVEISHGFFTGYTTKAALFNLTEGPSTQPQPFLSSYAIHFLLDNLTAAGRTCYTVAFVEPPTTHDPSELAPIAITARDPYHGIVGQTLVSFPINGPRLRRSLNLIAEGGKQVVITDWKRKENAAYTYDPVHSVIRRRRYSAKNAIDAVCFDGQCSCAERSCNMQCSNCASFQQDDFDRRFCGELFGTIGRPKSNQSYTSPDGDDFMVIDWDIEIFEATIAKPHRFSLYVSSCNRACLDQISRNLEDRYFLVGDVGSIVHDSTGSARYVVRDWDYLVPSSKCNVSSTLLNKRCAKKKR